MSVGVEGERVTASTKLSTVLSVLDRGTITIAATSLLGMAAVEGWQVFARYVLNDSPSWTEPIALLLMSTAMMLGAAAGVRANRHFGFFIAVEHAPARVRRVLLIVARLIAAAIGVMFAFWGADLMLDAWDFPMAGAPLPQGIVFAPMCVGGLLIALFAIEHLLTPPPDRSSAH
jgi:TRAP-type C4-dicarboxylate transport system permease small subunit